MVDCAAMLVHQATFAPEPCRYYAMADSSPQGGVDWLNSQFHRIRVQDLVEAFNTVHMLCYVAKLMRDKIDAFATESEDVTMDDEPPVSDEEFSRLQTRVQLTM